MKKTIAILMALIFVFAVATVSFAAEVKKEAAPAEKKEAPAMSEKKAAPKKATVTGEVLAVDAKAMTLTVKGPKKGDVMLSTDDKTSIMMGKDKKALADIMAGNKVKVEYMEADGKNVAKKITIMPAPAKKAEKMEKKEAAPAEKKAAPAKKAPGY